MVSACRCSLFSTSGGRLLYFPLCLAALLLNGCATPQPVAAPTRGAEPLLRIGLVVEEPSVRIRGQGRVSIRGSGRSNLEPEEEVTITASSGGLLLNGQGAAAQRLTFQSQEANRHLLVNGRAYRGAVEVLSNGSTLTAVNVIGTEAYLRGVIGVEMGRRQPNEFAALEAQAIASRTYALKNRGRFRSSGFDLRAGVQDQAYLGVSRETELGSRAVQRTAGLVVTYRGDLIAAFFHSTCGYSTASPDEVFRTVRAVPYLRPVSDRRPSTGYYCDISPRFRWTVSWDGNELRDILRRTIPSVLGIDAELLEGFRGLRIHGLGPSRRVTELRFEVASGEIPVFGPDLRRVLLKPDNSPLGSTAFEASHETRDGGAVAARISGAGWGHGVGMCQWGAIGRARAGQTANQILTTYYPGTRIERSY